MITNEKAALSALGNNGLIPDQEIEADPSKLLHHAEKLLDENIIVQSLRYFTQYGQLILRSVILSLRGKVSFNI